MDDRFTSTPGPGEIPPATGGGAAQAAGMSDRMQSLLSRAVEDQMNEQRQLQTLIGEVRQSLLQLQEEVRDTANAQTLELVRSELTGVAGEVRSSTTMFGERLEAVVRAVTASAQAMQTLSQQVGAVNESLVAQQQLLNAQQQQLGAVMSTLGELRTAGSTDALRADVAALHAELEAAGVRSREDSAAVTRQVAEHVDSAVMTLAEALLRRRGAGTPAATPAQTAAPAAPEPTGNARPDEPGSAEPLAPVVADGDDRAEPEPARSPWARDDDDEDPDATPVPGLVGEAAPSDVAGEVDVAMQDAGTPAVDEPDDAVPSWGGGDWAAADDADALEQVTARDPAAAAELAPDADAAEAPGEPVTQAETAPVPGAAAPPPAYGGWGQPAGSAAADPGGAEGTDDSGEKRRPWWRPGG